MNYALLWLEGPLQSWGADSRFDRRETLPFPTRSGVLGLVCCAMGRGGPQEEWLAKWRPLTQTIVAYARDGIERPTMLRDFQMVGSGYDTKDPWLDLMIPKKSDGGNPSNPGTKLTYRFYLQDMAFACVLELPAEADEIAAKLARPVWNIYLGRKNCVPSDQVFRGLYPTEEEALARADEIARAKHRIAIIKVVDGEQSDGETIILNDVPLAFGLNKRYRDRQATILLPDDEGETDAESNEEDEENAGPDYFGALPDD